MGKQYICKKGGSLPTGSWMLKNYIVIDPNGVEHNVINLPLFCEENNLHHGCMLHLATVERSGHMYKKWKCRPAQYSEEEWLIIAENNKGPGKGSHRIKNWICTDPEGNRYEISNLLKFCKVNNLTESCMRDVANGKSKYHRGGWKCERVI